MDFKPQEKIYPIRIDKYERYEPDLTDKDMISKMNDVITYLNAIGQISGKVVDSWNNVMKWVMDEGITEETEKKINEIIDTGVFDQLIEQSQQGWKAEVDSQLASKVTKGDLSVTDINKNLGKFDQTYMSDEFLQQMAGTTPINATPADNSITTVKLVDRAGTLIKLSKTALERLSPSQQRLLEEYNKTTLNLLKNVNNGGTLFYVQGTGATSEYVDNDSFLPVSKILRFNYGAVTSYVTVNQRVPFSVNTLPVWGGWIRKTDLINLGNRGIYGQLRVFKSDGSSYQIRTAILNNGKSLEVGYSEVYTELGVQLEISVKEEFKGWIFIQCKTLSHSIADGVDFYTRWVVNEVATTGKLDIANYMMIDNQEILPFKIYPETESQIPYTITELNDEVKQLKSSNLLQSDWYGKRAAMIGDSLVQGGGYITPLNEMLGFAELRNYGVAGRPMANGTANGPGNNTTGRMLAGETLDYSPIDLVIIAAGTNDFKLNVPIGTMQESGFVGYNTNEFYGAYQDLIEYLLTFKSTMRIVLMTPLHRDNGGYNIYSTNTAGHKLNDYRQAIIKIGENYSLPVVDMYANAGINQFNFDMYAPDKLHINELGGKRAGGYLAHQIAKVGL